MGRVLLKFYLLRHPSFRVNSRKVINVIKKLLLQLTMLACIQIVYAMKLINRFTLNIFFRGIFSILQEENVLTARKYIEFVLRL